MRPQEPAPSDRHGLRPTKIFVVSLHRCATQSVDLFLTQAGFKTCHWPSVVDGVDYETQVIGRETDLDSICELLRPVFDSFDTVSDVPVPVLYRQLDAAYPDSRFIAITRPTHDWIRSVRRHCHLRQLDPYERVQYWRYLPDRPTSLDDVTDDDLVGMYDQHYRALREYFDDRTDFVLLDLEEAGLARRLSTFLGTAGRDLPHIDYDNPTTHWENAQALREALDHSRAEAEGLREEIASLRARATRDASMIEALNGRLDATTRDLRRIEESVTWQLFQRARNGTFAMLGGEQSRAVAFLQTTWRMVGRRFVQPSRGGSHPASAPGMPVNLPSGRRSLGHGRPENRR